MGTRFRAAVGPARNVRRPPRGDLDKRQFTRPVPDQLWVTDITEHPTREGRVYCAVVLDACSRRVVGWSIDSTRRPGHQRLDMAIRNRAVQSGVVIHSDHRVQYTSWAFTDPGPCLRVGALHGSIGDCYDNAMIRPSC